MRNQIKGGMILSYVSMALQMLIGLLYTPIMIRLLGQSEYGLYNTVAATIGMLSVLKLGFNASYVRYYAKYRVDNENDKINKLNGMFLVIFTVIGIICLICGLFLSLNLEFVFDSGLSKSEYSIAKILMLLLTVKMAIAFPMSVFSNIISANERFIFLKALNIISIVVTPVVTLPFLLVGFRSIAIVIISFVISLAIEIVEVIYVLIVLKNKFVFNGFDGKVFRSLFVFSAFIAINIIVDQINWNVDKMLIGRYRGTIEVAVYSVGYALFSYYKMFSTSISGVFTPRIHKIINKSENLSLERKELTELFIKVGRLQYIILGLLASGMVFFGKEFIIKIWAGQGYEEAYYVAILLVFSGTIPLIQNLGIEIQRAKNIHKFRSILYLLMAIINIIFTIILCPIYGVIGATVGTVLSLLIANVLIMNIFYYKKCNIDILLFWKEILKLSKGLIIPIMFGVTLKVFIEFDNVTKIILGIIVYTVVYCISVIVFGMNKYEKKTIVFPIIHRLKGIFKS